MGKQAHRTIIVGIIVVLIALVVGSYYSLTAARITARSQAVRIARTQGHIERTDFFAQYNRQSTYYCVGGYDQHRPNTYKYVLINGHTGRLRAISGDQSLPDQARSIVQESQHPKKITRVALGYHRHQLVWEVTYFNRDHTVGYYLLNFKNTKIIQIIDNL